MERMPHTSTVLMVCCGALIQRIRALYPLTVHRPGWRIRGSRAPLGEQVARREYYTIPTQTYRPLLLLPPCVLPNKPPHHPCRCVAGVITTLPDDSDFPRGARNELQGFLTLKHPTADSAMERQYPRAELAPACWPSHRKSRVKCRLVPFDVGPSYVAIRMSVRSRTSSIHWYWRGGSEQRQGGLRVRTGLD
jgi:hypothetical protein